MTGVKQSSEEGNIIPINAKTQEIVILRDVEDALSGLSHGEITITVRNGRVIQIERIARTRPTAR